MMWKVGEYEVDPVLERALDVLFILHADHEQNCGTTAMRVVGSAHADPYIACAAAAAALYGPLHGGANEAVVRMLTEIGSIDNVPAFIEDVKAGKGRLMGFGHRVYKNYDPRATIIKQTAVRGVRGHRQEPAARHRAEARRGRAQRRLLQVAASSTRTSTSTPASSTRPWASRSRCSPCCSPSPARRAGWPTGSELLGDKDQKIARPRQAYVGAGPARLRPDRRTPLTGRIVGRGSSRARVSGRALSGTCVSA